MIRASGSIDGSARCVVVVVTGGAPVGERAKMGNPAEVDLEKRKI